jgi:hypothetical protein
MSQSQSSKKCATPEILEVWAHPMGVSSEILLKCRVKTPTTDEMESELIDCVSTATDSLIRATADNPWDNVIGELVEQHEKEPWSVSLNYLLDDSGKWPLYKLWYDSVTLKLGVQPQVKVYSEKKPKGMPDHWIFVHSPPPVSFEDSFKDSFDSGALDGPAMEFMHPGITPDDWFQTSMAMMVPMAVAIPMPQLSPLSPVVYGVPVTPGAPKKKKRRLQMSPLMASDWA